MTDAPDEPRKFYPPGSPEALAEHRRMMAEIRDKLGAGRRAILDAEEWRPDGAAPDDEPGPDDDDGGDDDDTGGRRSPPDESARDHVLIPRFFGKVVRMVPISMPDDAPITCLGKNGRVFYYLSPQGEMIELQDSEHGQAHIRGLWAPELGALHRAFPQFNQARDFKGFAAQYAADAMTAACGRKGIFDPHMKLRGKGCWVDDDGQLIQHLGNLVLAGGKEHKPGEIGEHVYIARDKLPAPKKGGRGDAQAIYERFQKWNWARGELDARLLLGQISASVLGAALDWRPMAFLTGDGATGKSTLQKLCRQLLPGRLVATVDATEAALRGLLGQDSVAISFDEIEADALSDKAQNVMKLARTAASGDDAYRSSSSQQIKGFTLRGAFLFSAIIPPSMRQQDMQRFAFLRLQTLPDGAKLPPLKLAEVRDLGAGLVGRITGAWDRWPEVLQLFVDALEARGHANRGAMQFGTLLAAAHCVLEDGLPDDDTLARWCDPLHRQGLFEYENNEPIWLQAWRHLMSAQPDVWRTDGYPTVAEMVRRYLVAHGADSGKDEAAKIHDKLGRAGLAIVQQRSTGRIFLAIPPRHQAIAAIYATSDFRKHGGEGAWSIPLRGAPKIEGPAADRRGVLHVDNVPRLDRQKCPMFWLDGQALIGGAWTPIFDREVGLDEVEAPMDERMGAYYAALARATTTDQLEKARERARPLLDALAAEGPDGAAEPEEKFNLRWVEIEGGGQETSAS